MTVILLQGEGNELYLMREGERIAYHIGCAPKTTFDGDAEMLAAGKTSNWGWPRVTVDSIEDDPVAIWREGKVLVRRMGRAAQVYTGVTGAELDLLPKGPDFVDRAQLREEAAADAHS